MDKVKKEERNQKNKNKLNKLQTTIDECKNYRELLK